jgi:hypothetical protein
MSYGIEILNVNGNYIWTTEDQEHLEVVDSGTVANNGSVTYTKANEFLALNRPNTGYLTGTYNDTTFTNLSGTTVNWIKVRRTTQQSTASSSQYSGDYGLESYNSSGNITFSSGFAKGLKLLQVHTPLSLTGGTDPLGGSSGDSIYSGDPTGVYYTPSLMDWDPYTGGNDGSQALDCANFSYSGTTGIKLIAYLSRYDRFGNNTTNTFDNRGFMLVFKRNG